VNIVAINKPGTIISRRILSMKTTAFCSQRMFHFTTI
jgi:hypothetical protein